MSTVRGLGLRVFRDLGLQPPLSILGESWYKKLGKCYWGKTEDQPRILQVL